MRHLYSVINATFNLSVTSYYAECWMQILPFLVTCPDWSGSMLTYHCDYFRLISSPLFAQADRILVESSANDERTDGELRVPLSSHHSTSTHSPIDCTFHARNSLYSFRVFEECRNNIWFLLCCSPVWYFVNPIQRAHKRWIPASSFFAPLLPQPGHPSSLAGMFTKRLFL